MISLVQLTYHVVPGKNCNLVSLLSDNSYSRISPEEIYQKQQYRTNYMFQVLRLVQGENIVIDSATSQST